MSISILKGSITILGKTVRSDEKVIIHRFRNYIIEALEDAELDIVMANESDIQPVDVEDPYKLRNTLAVEIVSSGLRKIIVIGDTDSGKTSFTTLLLNTAISAGLKPCIIDGDIGQANVGPPGFISLGVPVNQVLWNTEIPAYIMRFVGDIRPQNYIYLIPRELRWLAEKAESSGCNMVVIDTDGWVRDSVAIHYKHYLIEVVEPDALVVIGGKLSRYFKKYEKIGVKVYEVPEPRVKRARNREERRLLRSMRYRDFLADAPLRKIEMNSVLVTGHPLFHGYPVDASSLIDLIDGRVIYVSQLMDELHVYGFIKTYNGEEIAKRLGATKVKIYQPGFERNIYCGIRSLGGSDYPCIVEKLSFEDNTVVIRTRYQDRIDVLKLSPIKLRDDYTEEFIEV
ncbi:Clp1/GlmU family protein [Desulfurococcus amylolyticus]|uniref:Clp1/GlmU family protein n=1 Tax=Desulfurococcus amylolyticus TaxID=94694 RepID=UPI0023EF5F43|nr:Clp1/GlmU family protein [Desulfurococcus amylolyticus]